MLIDQEIRKLVARIEENDSDSESIDMLIARLSKACVTARHVASLPVSGASDLYPIDHEGYAVAFDPLEEEGPFVDAWQRFGFVVGKNILTPEQCHQMRLKIEAQFEAVSRGTCSLDRPDTWIRMPKDNDGTPLLLRGFLEIYHDDVLAQARQNVRAYIQHVLIWGRTDLWTSFDRIGVKLPHHEESKALPLHVDQNPNIHPSFKTVQGVLALTDCPRECGTFKAVPASKNVFSCYAGMASNKGEYVELDMQTEIGCRLAAQAQTIPLRAGHLISWDSRTTHANTENTSDDTRMVLYMAAGPTREDDPLLVAERLEAFYTGIGSNAREALMHASKKPRYTAPEILGSVRRPEKLNRLGQLLYGIQSYGTVATTPAP